MPRKKLRRMKEVVHNLEPGQEVWARELRKLIKEVLDLKTDETADGYIDMMARRGYLRPTMGGKLKVIK